MKKKLLLVLLLFLAVVLAVILFGEKKEADREALLKGNSFIEGLKIVNKKDGNNVWTLIAKRADIIESKNQARLSNITMVVENNGMKINSLSGLYDMETRNLTLDGRITAEAKDYMIITESAELDNSKGEIKTKGDVKVRSKKFDVEGSGMKAGSSQKVRILKDVKATFYR